MYFPKESLIIISILHMKKKTYTFVDKPKSCLANIVPRGSFGQPYGSITSF